MPTFDEMSLHLLGRPSARRLLLIGGCLGMVPLVNLLLLGWTLRYMRLLRAGHTTELPGFAPSTANLRALLNDTLRALGVLAPLALATIGLGALLGFALAALLQAIGLPLFAETIAWIPLSLGIFLFSCLWASALWHFLAVEEQFSRMLPLEPVLQRALGTARSWIFPVLAAHGIIALGWPLYGFPLMLCTFLLTPWMSALFLHLKNP